MQRVWSETLDGKEEDSSASAASTSDKPDTSDEPLPAADVAPATPPNPSSKGLPEGYVDLRIGGVGLVLDLGWHRTDAGLRWEVENVRQAAEAKHSRRAMREGRHPPSHRKQQQQQPQPKSVAPPPSPADKVDDGRWLRSPFTGIW